MAEQQPVARSPLPLDTEAWRFAVYGWGGQRLLLRVLPGDDGDDAPRKRNGRVALRVELLIDGVGRVVIQMEPAGDGVLLELAADEESALRHLRQALPEIADAVRRAGLRVVRRLTRYSTRTVCTAQATSRASTSSARWKNRRASARPRSTTRRAWPSWARWPAPSRMN